MSKFTLGIDINKKTFDAAVLLSNEKWKHKKFKHNQHGFTECLA